ncbi:CPBP family intramembrane glutamic endopeptidase [Butyrivibrio sp. VCB2006]|uniref:CPBP family intramembrane glutamic endopeptidase n=1 Tax=Butyrivibrio sp. VCB2006 TaxID=1280679 RepID=UPI0004058328|nr:type II CAAX endopeptidase family protein [Butyrivibrio sp. VCB2006]
MDYRRANRTYLYMILATLGLVLVLSLWYLNGGSEISILANNILSEAVVLIPAIAAVLYSGEKFSVLIPFRKIKVTSVVLIVVYVITLFPMVAFVNSISMLFVENAVAAISDDVLKMPMWVMFLSIGILGPFVEEVIFRGVILQSYQRTGRIIGSILLSSILFGMMHMNFNQFAYGVAMGIMLALLVEATGTVLASFIAHAVFNSIEVVMMYVNSDAIDEASELASDYMGQLGGTVSTIIYHAYLLVAAVLFTTLALLIVRKISENEGRKEFLLSIPHCRKQGYKLVTIPLIIAMVIAVGFMFFSIAYV